VSLGVLLETHHPDVVVTLGDLVPDDLDALGRYDVPVLGVYGNHDDGRYLEASNATDLHRRTATVGGVSFAGLEGSPRYKRGAALQYSQREMDKLARRLPAAAVLVTHAPPRGVHDEPDDRAHQGFDGVLAYLERVRPRLHLHGHTPAPARHDVRVGPTLVMHVVGHRLIEVLEPADDGGA
jgi:uncharacterized protein